MKRLYVAGLVFDLVCIAGIWLGISFSEIVRNVGTKNLARIMLGILTLMYGASINIYVAVNDLAKLITKKAKRR